MIARIAVELLKNILQQDSSVPAMVLHVYGEQAEIVKGRTIDLQNMPEPYGPIEAAKGSRAIAVFFEPVGQWFMAQVEC